MTHWEQCPVRRRVSPGPVTKRLPSWGCVYQEGYRLVTHGKYLTVWHAFGICKAGKEWHLIHTPSGATLAQTQTRTQAYRLGETLLRLRSIPWSNAELPTVGKLSTVQWRRIRRVFRDMGLPEPVAREVV